MGRIRCGGIVAVSVVLAAWGWAPAWAAPSVSVVETVPVIERKTRQAPERLVYIAIDHPGEETLRGLRLWYPVRNRGIERRIIDVPPGGAWDTLWLPEPPPPTLPVELRQEDRVLWSGELTLSGAPHPRVSIPTSPPVRLGQLRPLMLRGTNYLPRETPWPGIWRHGTPDVFERELRTMASLHINSFRTFLFFDEEAGLVRRDGTVTAECVARVHDLLEVADRFRLKVILCLTGSHPYVDELDTWRRFIRTAVEPFANDGRVLMWDLINEPGGELGPQATPELARWIQEMWPLLEETAPNHLLTVGLAWQFAPLWDLGVRPPVAQFHNYSGAVGVQPQDEPPVRNVADDLRMIREIIGRRPLIIGEFGMGTAGDRGVSLERQEEIYRHVLEGAEAATITGVYNWTLFEFVPDWMGPFEQHFGIVRPDGTLKPAGETLRDTYGQWRRRVQAPWERRVPGDRP